MITGDDYERVLAHVRELTIEDVEIIVAKLKENSFSQVDCIRGVMDLTGFSLAEAKRVVHFSQAWSASRESNEELHASLAAELDDM